MKNRMKLINEWVSFCNKEMTVDASHFYTLFHEGRTEQELEQIFSFFLESKDLIGRMNYLSSPNNIMIAFSDYPLLVNKISNNELIELIQIDIEEKKKLCTALNDLELLEVLNNVDNFEFVNKTQFHQLQNRDFPHIWLMEAFGDYFIDLIPNEEKLFALSEAFYGLTNNYQLVWYLMQPTLKTAYDTQLYADIWRKGGDYLIDYNKIYILNVFAES